MAGETTVGSIVGFLRLNADQFHREVTLAIAEVERLDGKDATVNVHADTTGAAAKLALVEKQVDQIDKSNARVAQSSKGASRGMGALATAVLALGPAAVPLAAATVGLAAGLGGLGTAGVLAFVGIRNEMKASTDVGIAYSSSIAGLKTEFNDLAKVAATNTLGSFQSVVADLQSRTPELTGMVGEFSTIVGKAGANIAGGLLSGFVALEPLMRDASVYVLDLTSRFRDLMSGPGVVSFGDYIRSVFPQVMQDVENIVTVALRLVAAFAPLGGGVLSMLGTLATLLNQIPVDVLATLAQGAWSVYFGFRAWQALSGPLKTLEGALGGIEGMSQRAATGLRTMQAAAGLIGVAIAGLTWLMSANAEATRRNQQASDDLADALIRSNGAIDENVRLTALKNAQDSGALDNARLLGISTQQIVDAYLGQAGALGDLSTQRDAALKKQKELVDAGKADATTMSDVENAYLNLQNQLAAAGIQWDGTKVKIQQHNDALKQTATKTSEADIAARNLASTYGTSAGTFQTAVKHQQDMATQAANATVQMQLENNVAGLLKQSLDALNGKSLDAAQAQNSFDSQLANMGDHITKTGKKVKFTTTSIHDMSAASVALRGQLLGQITAAQQTAEAYGEMKGSSEEGRKKLAELKDQIIKNATAHGVDKKAVTDYVNEFLKVPKSVPPTKLDVDKARATQKVKEFVGVINGIPTYREVFISVGSNAGAAVAGIASAFNSIGATLFPKPKKSAGGKVGFAGGGKVPGYAGGTIVGPGTGTSDSVMAMVRETNKVLAVSAGEGISTAASMRVNEPAIMAGNRGAKLQVAGADSREDMRYLARLIEEALGRMKPGRIGIDQLSKGLV